MHWRARRPAARRASPSLIRYRRGTTFSLPVPPHLGGSLDRALIPGLFIALVVTTIATAQETGSLDVGSRVRVTHHCGSRAVSATLARHTCMKHTGTLVGLRATSLVVSLDTADSLEVALATTTRLEVSHAKASSGRFRGGLLGIVIGAPLGWGMGLLVELIACGTACGGDFADRGVWVGAGAGLVLGALLGGIAHDRWIQVPLERLRLRRLRGTPVGFGAGLAVPL